MEPALRQKLLTAPNIILSVLIMPRVRSAWSAAGAIKRMLKAQNPNDVWALANGESLFAWRMGVKIYGLEGK
jgi:hypothetical protein